MMQFKDLIVRKRPATAERDHRDDLEDDAADTVSDFAEIAERVEAGKAMQAPAPSRGEIASERLRATHGQQRQAQTRPNIWDLDDDEEGDTAEDDVPADEGRVAPAGNARADASALAEAAARAAEVAAKGTHATAPEPARRRGGFLPAKAAAAPAASSGGGSRAKTRILGFHGGDLEADILTSGTRAAPAAAARFPAGWIVVLEGPGRGASFTILSGVSTIGRGADQTISLDFGDMSISRENHASIAYDEEQNRFYVGHGGKSNIVRRNGAPVLSTEELDDGDLIRIGKTTLRFVALCGPDFTWAKSGTDGDDDAPEH